jgi:hypothetical protein
VAPTEKRSVTPEFIEECPKEFWPGTLLQTEDVDNGYSRWHWELSFTRDTTLQIKRTRSSTGKMQADAGALASTMPGAMPGGMPGQSAISIPPPSKPAGTNEEGTTIWTSYHTPNVKVVLYCGASLYFVRNPVDGVKPGATSNPFAPYDPNNQDARPSWYPCKGVQLFHGGVSIVRDDGSRVQITPIDPDFVKAQQELTRN